MAKIDSIKDEIGRELDQRKRVYPRLIQDNKLNRARADIQVNNMTDALKVFSVMTQAELDEFLKRYEDTLHPLQKQQLNIFP